MIAHTGETRRTRGWMVAALASAALPTLALVLGFASDPTGFAPPHFKNGQLIARRMEQHYNSAYYERRLRPATLVTRVRCGYEDYGPSIGDEAECTAKVRVQRPTDTTFVVACATWTLAKLSATRGKLRWSVKGPGVLDRDSQIIASTALGLKSW